MYIAKSPFDASMVLLSRKLRDVKFTKRNVENVLHQF